MALRFLSIPNFPSISAPLSRFLCELRDRCTKMQFLIKSIWFSSTLVNFGFEKKWETMEHAALPDWLKTNEFLRCGHRPPTPSLIECVKSMFSLHTETLNIWTHLLACLGFLVLLVKHILTPESELSLTDKLALSPFIIGQVTTYGLSTVYHTTYCHSPSICKLAEACDALGIIIAILGIIYSSMFYLWWCQWHYAVAYSLIYTIKCSFLISFVFAEVFFTDNRSTIAGIISVALGCLSVFHIFATHGATYVVENYPIIRILLTLFFCAAGVFFYATRIPEKLWPGKFDIWLQSHTIFHLCVIAAGSLGINVLYAMAEHYRQNGKCDEAFTIMTQDDKLRTDL